MKVRPLPVVATLKGGEMGSIPRIAPCGVHTPNQLSDGFGPVG